MNFFAFVLYNVIFIMATPFLLLFSFWRLVLRQKSWQQLPERFGFSPKQLKDFHHPLIWIHASCVGEVMAAKPIRQAIRAAVPQCRILNSAFTPDGMSELRKQKATAGDAIYLPLDFLPCVWLSMRRVRPDILILVETELWPNLLAVARHYRAKIIVVNGRISERSFRTAIRLRFFYRWFTSLIDRFCMQTAADAERIIRLGADPARVTVNGNSKFDQPMVAISGEERRQMQSMLSLREDEPVVLAGSTHAGEEAVVLHAFTQVKAVHPTARLIIAPRDISRAPEIEILIREQGFTPARRTQLGAGEDTSDAVIILDTIGELMRVYALSTTVFVGGSMVPVGGHNILEALSCGNAALFGPFMHNFRDIAAIAIEEHVGFMVQDRDQLTLKMLELLNNATLREEIAVRARQVIARYAGASQQCAEAVSALLHD